VTTTLFLLEILPYNEEIYRANHMELAYKWLGKDVVQAIQQRFVDMALTIGYRYPRQALKNGAAVVLMVLTAKRSTDLASISRADLEAWEAQTRRSKRVARKGVTTAEKVLAAMGYLEGESPRRAGGASRSRATWGRTAPSIIDTCQRFLTDLRTMRAPGTVDVYETILRRFGDWLGEHDPTVRSVSEVRRQHIEGYKQALTGMRIGVHISSLRSGNLGDKRGETISRNHQMRCLSCVRAFFEMIDTLEYPERPNRRLFIRGDLGARDHELPRFIPDPEWHRIVDTVRTLTPELVKHYRLPQPYERSVAILTILLECGLRAGELSRLDTGCVIYGTGRWHRGDYTLAPRTAGQAAQRPHGAGAAVTRRSA
jgi:hypothetical protein